MLYTEWLGGTEISWFWICHCILSCTLQWLQSNPPPRMRSWTWPTVKLICSHCSQTPRMRSWTWPAVKLICSHCSWTPPQDEEFELGLQWSWSAVTAVKTPPKMRSWTWPAVKLICSHCSQTPRMRSWTWPAVKLICSHCSQTPPGWGVELGLQWSWICSDCSRTPLYPTELQLSNFSIYR